MPAPASDALNDGQRRFCEEYVVDCNATQAAIRAGYSKKTAGQQGHGLLKKPKIQAAIRAEIDRISEKTGITAERVREELGRLAFSDVRKLFRWDEESARLVPSDQLEEEDAAAISEVQTESKTWWPKDGEGESETTVRLKLKVYDKVRALEQLAKHFGMFTEEIKHTGTVKMEINEITLVYPEESDDGDEGDPGEG